MGQSYDMASWEQNVEESTQGGTLTPMMDLKGSVHDFSRALEELKSASQRAQKDKDWCELKITAALSFVLREQLC